MTSTLDHVNPAGPEQPVRVGIGLIEHQGAYLIRRRLEGQAMAGYWEFPGGKCEPGEALAETTRRECFEEVGVEVVVGEKIHEVEHRYPHGLVQLHYFRCRIAGTSRALSADSGFQWVAATDLLRYRFPEANDAVIEILAREAGAVKSSHWGES